MSPAQFVTLCVGGIVALTPLAVYLIWLSQANRRGRPLVVSAAWEFAGLLAGLSGLLFCSGVVVSSVCMELSLLAGGAVGRFVSRLPLIVIFAVPMLLLFWVFLRSARRSLASRRDALAVYCIEESRLHAAIASGLAAAGIAAERRGDGWYAGAACLVEVSYFPAFCHGVVALAVADRAVRQSLERHLRAVLPGQPAAESPAAMWISAAATCCTVAVGCCVLIVFAVPFL